MSLSAGCAFLRFDWLNFVRVGRRGPDAKHLLRLKFDEPCRAYGMSKKGCT